VIQASRETGLFAYLDYKKPELSFKIPSQGVMKDDKLGDESLGCNLYG